MLDNDELKMIMGVQPNNEPEKGVSGWSIYVAMVTKRGDRGYLFRPLMRRKRQKGHLLVEGTSSAGNWSGMQALRLK